MSAGPNAQQTISPGDARAYVLGHVMGRRRGQGAGSGTFGFSSGKAKIWEPKATGSLSEFRQWCVEHAAVLAADSGAFRAGSRLALLQLPDRLDEFPDSPAVVILPAELLSDSRILKLNAIDTDPLDLVATGAQTTTTEFRLELSTDGSAMSIRINATGTVDATTGTAVLVDTTTGEVTDMTDFLEQHPPTIIFGDGSVVVGQQIVRQRADIAPLSSEARIAVDWSTTNLSCEFPADPAAALDPAGSVAGRTLAFLEATADWIVQDHLPGELADFITIRRAGMMVEVDLVHCKKPGGAAATRVTDIQEVLAQAMRSVYIATSGGQFWTELLRRLRHRNATRVVRGDTQHLEQTIQDWSTAPPLLVWTITAVQPGVSDSQLDTWTEGNALFSAAYSACRGQGITFRLVDAT